MEVDPQFIELCDTLFGKAVDPSDVWEYLYTREGISKMNPAPSDVATKTGRLGRLARRAAPPIGYSVTGGLIANQLPQNQKDSRRLVLVKKSEDVTWEVTFSKIDEDKRQVFGWASVSEMHGKPVVDRQGDMIDQEELERAAYVFVEKSRKGGHQHRRDGENPFHASNMIESVVFTDEKVEKMGLPDDFPRAWWVGFQVHDEPTWEKVKKREVTGFSVHGRGKRRVVA